PTAPHVLTGCTCVLPWKLDSRQIVAYPRPAGELSLKRADIAEGTSLLMRYRIAFAFVLAAAFALGLVPAVPFGAASMVAADSVAGPYIGLWTDGSASQATQLGPAGADWARAIATWSTVQPAPATFDFGALDASINAASGGGQRRVLVMVRNNPSWA